MSPSTLLREATQTIDAARDLRDGDGVRVMATGLTTVHRNGTRALDAVDVAIEPGQVTAVIGPSGAGKTTLLAALAGVTPPQRGTVTFQDRAGVSRTTSDVRIGFVPQDDILHGELPLERTLRYSAALRLDVSTAEMWQAVDDAMDTLGLTGHGDVRVASLSGGQRKRASIACEILTRPEVCFLDEPTSGLDPAAASGLIRCLQRMAAEGATVVFTTHSVADIEAADHVVVLAPGGRLVATGTPAEVLARTGAASFAELYESLAGAARPRPDAHDDDGSAGPPRPSRPPRPRRNLRSRHGPGAARQWLVLSRRATETIAHNRLTLAILLGSPAAVIAMFAVLFRPGAFDPGGDPTGAVMISYWLAFAGFFFGLTFGLLQVCAEAPVLRREHHAGVGTIPYVCSKLTLLGPFLIVINATMLLALRALDRLPALPPGTYAAMFVTMALNAIAALCLGLLASAAVTSTAQAALALPMLCFPAVLFAGAVVPVPLMAGAGRAVAAAMPDRWAFEAIAGHLGVGDLSAAGSPHAALGASSSVSYWALLTAFALVLGVAAHAAVARRATT